MQKPELYVIPVTELKGSYIPMDIINLIDDYVNHERRVKIEIYECATFLVENQSLHMIWLDMTANKLYQKFIENDVSLTFLRRYQERIKNGPLKTYDDDNIILLRILDIFHVKKGRNYGGLCERPLRMIPDTEAPT